MFYGIDKSEKGVLMYNNSYLEKKRKIIELVLRLYMGLQQLIYRPYKNIIIVALIGLFHVVWGYKDKVFCIVSISELIMPIYQQFISIMLLIALILFLLAFIKQIGYWSARRDESCLMVAFKPTDLRNGYPILISKKRLKGTDVVKSEFYTNIPKNRWEELQVEIADALNVTFVKPCIEYGGRRKDKAYRIVIYTTPNRKHKQRGIMYDERF